MGMSATVCLNGRGPAMCTHNIRGCNFAGDLGPKAYLDDHKARTAIISTYKVDVALVVRNVEAANTGDPFFKLLSWSSAGKPKGEGDGKDSELHSGKYTMISEGLVD